MGFYITGLGVLLSLVLAIYSWKHFSGNIYLAIFFLLVNLQELAIYSLHVANHPVIGAIMLHNFTPLLFLTGTSFYFYIRSLITNSARLYKKDLWHLLPTLFVLVVYWNYYIQPFDFKLDLVKQIRTDIHAFLFASKSLISPGYINLLRAISIFSYIVYALFLYYKKLPAIRSHSLLKAKLQKSAEWWFQITFGCFLVLATIYLTASIQLFVNQQIEYLPLKQILILLVYLILNAMLLFHPQVLYGFPAHNELVSSTNDVTTKTENEFVKANGSSDLLLFTDTYIDEIGRKLDTIINNKAFCNQDLSKSKLSNLTNIPLHHLSYYFSTVLNVKFTDWRNQLRIEHAKKLISSDLMKTMTLDAIASQSGFGNRQNFIAAFKKMTSMTPSEYINLVKSETCTTG
jgi:AraC-like DNA-binding protein